MAVADQFCLRWNDFQSNVSDAFKELREEKDFFDVTIVCEDSQVEAHKVILSACSPFFRNILRRNPHQHPLLYIKGVKFKEILSVLNFMYQGEVNVAQEELNSFLAVAEELKVKGLTQNNSSSGSSSKKGQENNRPPSHPRERPERDSFPPPKKQRTTINPNITIPQMQTPSNNSIIVTDNEDIQEVSPSTVKPEPNEESSNPAIQNCFSISQPKIQEEISPHSQGLAGARVLGEDESFPGDESYGYEQLYQDGSGIIDQAGVDANKVKVRSPSKLYGNWTIHHHPGDNPVVNEEDILHNTLAMDSMDSTDCFADQTQDWDAVVASRMLKKDNIWRCLDCPYMARNKTSVISHVQGKHLEDFGGYICKICGGKSGTYCGFEKHMSRQHKFSLARKNNVNSMLSVKFEEH